MKEVTRAALEAKVARALDAGIERHHDQRKAGADLLVAVAANRQNRHLILDLVELLGKQVYDVLDTKGKVRGTVDCVKGEVRANQSPSDSADWVDIGSQEIVMGTVHWLIPALQSGQHLEIKDDAGKVYFTLYAPRS